jgi:glycosyltransferase involved in cell wall biosynthesis
MGASLMRTVAYFTDSTDFGGAEQELLHLIAGLDRSCWQPLLFYHEGPGVGPLLAEARSLGVDLHPVAPMPLGIRGALRAPDFSRQLLSLQPDVFHANLSWPLACKYGLVAAVMARIPAIVATVQLFVDATYSRATRIQQRWLANRVGRYIVVSGALADKMQQVFDLPAHKLEVIPNAVPSERFAVIPDTALRNELTGGTARPLVLTVARLDAQKGHRYLLEAATQIPEAIFVLAGDGPERPALERQAAALGLDDRVRFLGRRSDIPALLAVCDLFVLPSLYEGLPLSILEAMAARRPVVATEIAGTCEAVTGGVTGLLVPPADPAALAQAIRRLLAEPARGAALADAAHARMQAEFSAAAMVQRVTNVYDRLLCGEVAPAEVQIAGA